MVCKSGHESNLANPRDCTPLCMCCFAAVLLSCCCGRSVRKALPGWSVPCLVCGVHTFNTGESPSGTAGGGGVVAKQSPDFRGDGSTISPSRDLFSPTPPIRCSCMPSKPVPVGDVTNLVPDTGGICKVCHLNRGGGVQRNLPPPYRCKTQAYTL